MADTSEFYGITLEFDSTTEHIYPVDMFGVAAEFHSEFEVFPAADDFGVTLELEELNKTPSSPSELTSIDGTQVTIIANGITSITMDWDIPDDSEYHPGEYLGLIRDAISQFEFWTKHRSLTDTTDNPVTIHEAYHDSSVYEITLDSTAYAGDIRLTVSDTATIPVYSWIKILQGDNYPSEFNRIAACETSVIKLQYPISKDLPADLTIAKVWVNDMVETTDYTIDTTTGYIETVATQFTDQAEAFARYKFSKTDIDHFEIWQVTGQNIEEYGAVYGDVTNSATAIVINAAIDSTTTSYDIEFNSASSGSYYTLYLYSVDSDGNTSLAKRLLIETVPSEVSSISGSYNSLTYDEVITFSDKTGTLPDGVNLYRCSGSWVAANAIKINVTPMSSTQFTDGPSNITNRVSSVIAPYPLPGDHYTYKLEREDTATEWATGTQNSIAGSSQIDIATKTQETVPVVIPPGWTDIPT